MFDVSVRYLTAKIIGHALPTVGVAAVWKFDTLRAGFLAKAYFADMGCFMEGQLSLQLVVIFEVFQQIPTLESNVSQSPRICLGVDQRKGE